MPQYDYRCKDCGQRFSLYYKTFAEYDAAVPRCQECGSADLARIISRVAVSKPNRDYSRMSSGEMLSVLESGDQRQVESLFQQVGGTSATSTSSGPDDTNAAGAGKESHADNSAPASRTRDDAS